MKEHYNEADLLETYYMQPGQSMPVMMHLAQCHDCAARYERLERKLREAAVCSSERPESFWARQRALIMRQVRKRPLPRREYGPVARFAAAAALALLLGAVVIYERLTPASNPVSTVATAAATDSAQEEPQLPSADPWESEELREFGSVVEWEGWIADRDTNRGELSL